MSHLINENRAREDCERILPRLFEDVWVEVFVFLPQVSQDEQSALVFSDASPRDCSSAGPVSPRRLQDAGPQLHLDHLILFFY